MGNKKLLLLMAMLLPALMFFSCSESEPVAAVPGDVVRISVALPEIYDLETRSTFGDDITGLNRMQWSVFEVSDKDGGKGYTHVDDGESEISVSEGQSTQNIDLTLMRGKKYVVAVCVSHNDNEFAEFKEGKITVNYDNSKCNDNSEEMFAGCSEEFSSDDAEGVAVELTRPFAQVNWGSSDLEDPTVKRHLPQTKATVTVSSQLYTIRDVVTGTLSEPVEGATLGEVACGCLPTQHFPSVDASVSMNKLVAMNYLLAGDEESTIDCKIKFTGNLDADVTANSAAIRANYRTNIYGDFLTFPEFVNIEVKTGWTTSNTITYTIAEAKAIWEEFKQGGNLVIPEGKVLDVTPFDNYNVKGGQNIELNGVLKLHTEQLNYNAGESANYEISGTGLLYIDQNYYHTIKATAGSLKISNIQVKSISNSYGTFTGSGNFIVVFSNMKLTLDNVRIESKYTPILTRAGQLVMNNCIIDLYSKPDNYHLYYMALYIYGGSNTITNCKFDSYLNISTSGTNNFSDCSFDSSLSISSGINTFEDCNIGSFVKITGGTSNFNNCIQKSYESSVNMTNGTCNINGGVFRHEGSEENTATFLLDGSNPNLTISGGDFYSNSDYSILRITDALKNSLVSAHNNKTANKNNQITVDDITQQMLMDNDESSIKLEGGRYEKGAYDNLKSQDIQAASGFKIIPWEEFPTGFQIVEDPSGTAE